MPPLSKWLQVKEELIRIGREPDRNQLLFHTTAVRTQLTSKDWPDMVDAAGTPVVPSSKASIRSSNITDFFQCYRLFALRHRLGLRSIYEDSFALARGTVFHDLFSMLAVGYSRQQALFELNKQQVELEDDITAAANHMGLLPNGAPVTTRIADLRKELGVGKAMAIWAWDNYPLQGDQFEIIHVERLLELVYPTLTSNLRIRLDVLIWNKEENTLWLVDHKTTDSDPRQKAATLLFNVQLKLYRLVLYGLLKSHPHLFPERVRSATVGGMYHNIIKVPGIRQKINEEYPEYVERVFTDYKDKLTAYREANQQGIENVTPPFVRSRIKFTGPLMSEDVLVTLREVNTALKTRFDLNKYPCSPDGAACFKWKRACEFLPLCQADKEMWPSIIQQRYLVRHRDDGDEQPNQVVFSTDNKPGIIQTLQELEDGIARDKELIHPTGTTGADNSD
jgi:hypothetical protein